MTKKKPSEPPVIAEDNSSIEIDFNPEASSGSLFEEVHMDDDILKTLDALEKKEISLPPQHEIYEEDAVLPYKTPSNSLVEGIIETSRPIIHKRVEVQVTFPDVLSRLLSVRDCDLDTIVLELNKLKLLVDLLSVQEKDYIEFIHAFIDRTKSLPSIDFINEHYPELSLASAPCYKSDLIFLISNFRSSRTLLTVSKEFIVLSGELPKEGISKTILNKISNLYSKLNVIDTIETNTFSLDRFEEFYNEKKTKPAGLLTGVKQIDEVIGGLNYGTVNTIFGYVGSFKTMCALNMAYLNTIKNNYNIIYVSLEVTKEDLWYNLISRHSNCLHLKEFGGKIGHEKIRKCRITDLQMKYIANKIIPEFKTSKGRLICLDETDFNNISEMEFEAKFHQIDKDLINQTGKGVDAIIIDHLHLLKYTGVASGDSKYVRQLDSKEVINSYVSFFRRTCLNFRGRQIIMVLLSQVNREGFNKATKKDGEYDLTAIAEANEIERSSQRIFSCYSNEQLKLSKLVKMQVLKNRSGGTICVPLQTYVNPEFYFFGDNGEVEDATPSINDFGSLLGSGSSFDSLTGGNSGMDFSFNMGTTT